MSTNQLSNSAAVHLIPGRLDDDPVACAYPPPHPMTRFSIKPTVVTPPVKEEAPVCRQG